MIFISTRQFNAFSFYFYTSRIRSKLFSNLWRGWRQKEVHNFCITLVKSFILSRNQNVTGCGVTLIKLTHIGWWLLVQEVFKYTFLVHCIFWATLSEYTSYSKCRGVRGHRQKKKGKTAWIWVKMQKDRLKINEKAKILA